MSVVEKSTKSRMCRQF